MKQEDILYEQTGDVGVLTLNRPERLNALSGDMVVGALQTLNKIAAEGSARALVITGAGRGFCSGADLAGGLGDSRLEDSAGHLGDGMRQGINPLIQGIVEAPFPVIAAVNGPAAGAGVGIALAADFMIASESMQLLLTFSRIGMGLDAGTSWFLSRQLGMRRATAISMLVEPIDASKAEQWGLAWSATADKDLMPETMKLANQLATGPTHAFAAQKRQIREAKEITLAEALDREADVQDELIKSEDLKEGITAFRERRQAIYSGR
ncbi:MAG: enoyl-CoA hydratase-related protein [Pseudomonadales bacterium]|nr:enoyl-CoA hydratase-related protein [Pseudomonadales bacterium]